MLIIFNIAVNQHTYGLLIKRNIWVVDQVFFFCVFMDLDFASVHKHAISSHLDRTSLVNKGFIIWGKTPKHDKFSLRDKARIPSGHDSSILPIRVANHCARFGSSCPFTKLSYNKNIYLGPHSLPSQVFRCTGVQFSCDSIEGCEQFNFN